jgi:DNA-binding transcriptional LysR family regulator
MTTVSFDALDVFRVVAQEQSFTRAAARLGQDKSRVSRTIRGLEASLGLSLLARTTRAVRLTADGEALLARVGPLLVGLDEALGAAPDRVEAPSGEVHVATTRTSGGRCWRRRSWGFGSGSRRCA